jgi:hypothetical protein
MCCLPVNAPYREPREQEQGDDESHGANPRPGLPPPPYMAAAAATLISPTTSMPFRLTPGDDGVVHIRLGAPGFVRLQLVFRR